METITITGDTITIVDDGADILPVAQAFLDAGYSMSETDRILNLLTDFESNRLQCRLDFGR